MNKKYALLKNGKIFVVVSEEPENNIIHCRIRGGKDESSFKVEYNNVELMGENLNELRSVENKDLMSRSVRPYLFVFKKSEIKEIIKENRDKHFYFSKKENIDVIKKENGIYSGALEYDFLKIKVSDTERLNLPKDLYDVLSITTPFNNPKYIIRNIAYLDKEKHKRWEYEMATLLIIDDEKYISLTLSANDENAIELLNKKMDQIGYKNKMTIKSTIDSAGFPSLIFQLTYRKQTNSIF